MIIHLLRKWGPMFSFIPWLHKERCWFMLLLKYKHSLAGQGQDGVAGWCMLAVSDRSMRSYWRLASVHNCSYKIQSTRLYNICSCLFNNLIHCTNDIWKGLRIQWTEIQSNQALYNILYKKNKSTIYYMYYNIPIN